MINPFILFTKTFFVYVFHIVNIVLFNLMAICNCLFSFSIFSFSFLSFCIFRDIGKVKISMNSNFTLNRRLRKHLYNDAIRISRDGFSVLAVNLKIILIGNNKMANKPLVDRHRHSVITN
jgi:hypothetical protein